MVQRRKTYVYNGPVCKFEHVILSKWQGITMAASSQQAINNLTFRVELELKYSPQAKITLDKKFLKEV